MAMDVYETGREFILPVAGRVRVCSEQTAEDSPHSQDTVDGSGVITKQNATKGYKQSNENLLRLDRARFVNIEHLQQAMTCLVRLAASSERYPS